MDKTQEKAAAAQDQRVTNVNALRSLHNNQVQLRHRVDGKTITFDREAYEDGTSFQNSGYNPDDWVLAQDFTEPEGPDHGPPKSKTHPAFEGTDQKIGTHMGETAEERAARGDLSAERTFGFIPGVTAEKGEAQLTPEIIKSQQSTAGVDEKAHAAEVQRADDARKEEVKRVEAEAGKDGAKKDSQGQNTAAKAATK